MRLSWLSDGLKVLLASTFACGCAGAEWEKVEIDAPYRAPKTLTVNVVAAPTEQEPAQALSDALVDELHAGNINAVVVPAGSQAADANVTLYHWAFRPHGVAWELENGGVVVVVASVDTATLGIAGTARGWVKGAGTVDGAATAVGRLIGRTIVTGRGNTEVRGPKTPHGAASLLSAR